MYLAEDIHVLCGQCCRNAVVRLWGWGWNVQLTGVIDYGSIPHTLPTHVPHTHSPYMLPTHAPHTRSPHPPHPPHSPLLCGTRLLHVPPHVLVDPPLLMAAVQQYQITHVTAIPSLWQAWLPYLTPEGVDVCVCVCVCVCVSVCVCVVIQLMWTFLA